MDSIFLLGQGDRAAFLQQIIHSFGCTYICLWSYLPQPSNCLLFLDGIYHEQPNQPSSSSSSSSGSLARRRFDEYRQSLFIVDDRCVPGLAFKNNLPYMELKSEDLLRLASNKVQLQFYQEAGIKIAAFLGCTTGEIELGFSIDIQFNLEAEMRNLFPEDFAQQTTLQARPSSSTSSKRSLSLDSTEYSPLLFNMPATSYASSETLNEVIQAALCTSAPASAPTASLDQQAMEALSHIRSIQLPTRESEEAIMAKAILTVISSSSPSSSTSSHQPSSSQKASAFTRYKPALSPANPLRNRRQNMIKRAFSFFASLNLFMRRQEHAHGSRPTNILHMIAERRRREKLNESFQALRSLLPPGSKRDKSSVLKNTMEYLNSLRAEIEELKKRNQILEERANSSKKDELPVEDEAGGSPSSSTSRGRIRVRVLEVAESTSDSRMMDLHVIVRGESNISNLIIQLLGFLRRDVNVALVSLEANTRMVQQEAVNHVILRLKIEGNEWDEAAFQEAVTRVVGDMAG